MTGDERSTLANRRALGRTTSRYLSILALTVVASCGGSSGNPLGNPPLVNNPTSQGGQKLSFAYFERCINPIFFTQFGTNECGASGCHDSVHGSGGALRVIAGAATFDVTNPANTPDVMTNSDMHRNFVSAVGETLISNPPQSRLVIKPLVQGIFHGGGQIFASDQDPNIKLMEYWIGHPVQQGQDEFAPSNAMFTPPDPNVGACNTQ